MTPTPFESIARLISELRAYERDAQQHRHIPCQSDNLWHASDYGRWADALEDNLTRIKSAFALHCIQCPQCHALALKIENGTQRTSEIGSVPSEAP